MTDFAIHYSYFYSYFDRTLGKSGHGEAIVRFQSDGDIDEDAGEGQGEEEGEGQGKGTPPQHNLLQLDAPAAILLRANYGHATR